MLLMGLDVGTTSIKAVLFDDEGRALAEDRADTPWMVTPMGVQLDASELVVAAKSALAGVLDRWPGGSVAALGITSMGESGVLLDSANKPLAPVIAWHDTRDGAELDYLRSAVPDEAFAMKTGLPLRAQWSLTKHKWLMRHVPESRGAVTRLNIAEWIAFSLGAVPASEVSLASRTGWFDLSARTWWDEALEWSGANKSLMPELVTAGSKLGVVSPQAELSRLEGAVITVAGHDHQAAVAGTGAFRPGDTLDSCGTAEALVRIIDARLEATTLLELTRAGITAGWSVFENKWTLLGGTQGGLTLQSILSLLGSSSGDVARLDAAKDRTKPNEIQVQTDDKGSTTVKGITPSADPAHVWQAALEEVTRQAKGIDDAMIRAAGGRSRLVVTGGWSRSTGLLRTKERAFGLLDLSPVSEAGARGAAFFGGLAAGIYSSVYDFPGYASPLRAESGPDSLERKAS